MSIARRDLLDGLCAEFLQHYREGRTIIAIDGRDGSGKTQFADDLAVRLGRGHSVFRASVDDFHRPRAERYARGEFSPEGYYEDAFDYELLRRVLLAPFRLGGSTGFVLKAFDVARDVPYEMDWMTGPQDATLIIDGVFINRPELRGLWNFTVWLDVEDAERERRLIERDGERSLGERYAGAYALYNADANPRARASAIIDNTDPADPRREFNDSC